MSKFSIKQKTLSGGLRTILLPRKETQSVTFLVLIGAGSRYETPKQWGLSHFLEHMYFKGTEKRPTTAEIAAELDGIGADFNAFTDVEYTGYYVKVAAKHLELGADVVSDMLLRPLFPKEEIEREKGTIVEEIKMYTDNPMWHIDHLWNQALFGDHAVGRRVDGLEETVTKFTRKDFVNYKKKHYHTENVVVVMAGNFDEKTAPKMLQEMFASLPLGSETHPKPAPKKMPAQRVVHESRTHLDQTHLIVGVPGLSMDDDRRYAAQLLGAILGGGMSSRLFLKVRERQGLAYTVRTSSDSLTDVGSFATYAGLRTDKAEFALQLILEEYDDIIENGVTEEELAKVKEMVRGKMALRLEETNTLANFAGMQELLNKTVETPEKILKHVDAVTADDVHGVAKDLLRKKNRALALLGPQRSSAKFEKLLT